MEEIVATAHELFEETKEAHIGIASKTKEELCEEWYEWFKKKSPSYLRDAVKKGLYRITVELPFQPTFLPNGQVDGKCYNWKGKSLYKRLTEALPGCKIEFCEEEYEEGVVAFPGTVLEISWRLKKKKKGFIAEVVEESVMPTTSPMMPSTSSMMPSTSSMMPSTSSSDTT